MLLVLYQCLWIDTWINWFMVQYFTLEMGISNFAQNKLVIWQLILFNSSFTFSGVRCARTGSEHAVWGAFGARGGGTLVVKEGAPLRGDWNKFKDYYCILPSLILLFIHFYLKKIIWNLPIDLCEAQTAQTSMVVIKLILLSNHLLLKNSRYVWYLQIS